MQPCPTASGRARIAVGTRRGKLNNLARSLDADVLPDDTAAAPESQIWRAAHSRRKKERQALHLSKQKRLPGLQFGKPAIVNEEEVLNLVARINAEQFIFFPAIAEAPEISL